MSEILCMPCTVIVFRCYLLLNLMLRDFVPLRYLIPALKITPSLFMYITIHPTSFDHIFSHLFSGCNNFGVVLPVCKPVYSWHDCPVT